MLYRFQQAILIISFIAFSWLMMQVVHEAGHVAGAVAGGGTVQKVVLHPLAFSRTDVSPNPHPLLKVWAGPAVGTLLPIIAWLISRLVFQTSLAVAFIRFFAGFCCIANGIYIGFGGNTDGMDTQVMLANGSTRLHLLIFAIPAILCGLWLWNGTGKIFGLGTSAYRVTPKVVLISVAMFSAVLILELAFVAAFA